MKQKEIIRFVSENRWSISVFTLATIVFIIQHALTISWDFSAYVMNAEYLFYGGDYFEVYRAPASILLLGVFLLIGRFGEYLFIIFVSALFFYSNIKLSDSVFPKYFPDVKKENLRMIFYTLSLSSFVLVYGLWAGTELLTLAFLELILFAVFSGKISGHWFALAFLSRYNSLIFAPFLFANKSIKKIAFNLLLTVAFVFPWLLYNRLAFGNFFTSIVDSYALNIYFRDYTIQAFQISTLWLIITWMAPFLLIGLAITILQIYKKGVKHKTSLISLAFLAVTILIFYDFLGIPLKIDRYLFNLSLPIAFFSTLGFLYVAEKAKTIKNFLPLIALSILILTSFLITLSFVKYIPEKAMFERAGNALKENGLENCETLSPHWTPLNYLVGNARPLGSTSLEEAVRTKRAVLIFTNSPTMDDSFTEEQINSLPKIYTEPDFIILGDPNLSDSICAKVEIYNPTHTKDHCKIIGKVAGNLPEKICQFINR